MNEHYEHCEHHWAKGGANEIGNSESVKEKKKSSESIKDDKSNKTKWNEMKKNRWKFIQKRNPIKFECHLPFRTNTHALCVHFIYARTAHLCSMCPFQRHATPEIFEILFHAFIENTDNNNIIDRSNNKGEKMIVHISRHCPLSTFTTKIMADRREPHPHLLRTY